jgi:biotin carboxyl carrier protein
MSHSKKCIVVTIDEREYLVEVGDLSARPITTIVDGKTYQVQVQSPVLADQPTDPTFTRVISQTSQPDRPLTSEDAITAPMPGDIIEIMVHPGDKVARGQELCVLEAMKMKNVIRSPRDGQIKSIDVARHQTVAYGDVLLRFE